ncbi:MULTISPECIES: hypothetical protein [unclassified Leptolyngbya]|uniref:hypothetical protein n=1 Tax=unclassified Leptolyngbya TaxID=2650499 RepID=UPI00168349E4|nr:MULTISPECIES: hypothetical protein [unclassified Leptolyngbya]MBD1911984.1 hypothetical protein [Leptolyngbya sp. FACHB-8]MBD2155354.1 hypothetical protein [Leptolyngbya sp. FACHB-16]
MSHDVQQWLGEIKNLQQKLEDAHKERDGAFASAMNWRELYQTEAQQRRTEAALSQRKIEELQDELEQLQGNPPLPPVATDPSVPEAVQELVSTLKTPDELRQALTKALMECDRLTRAIKAEQETHARTRRELTAALGDTVDQLTRVRGGHLVKSSVPTQVSGESHGNESAPKTPSYELPILE